MTDMPEINIKKIGIAGMGTIGRAVAKALLDGVDGLKLEAVSDIKPAPFDIPHVDFEELAARCDLIVEALPAAAVSTLAEAVFAQDKNLVLITPSALILHPEIMAHFKSSAGRIIIPSGSITGLDGVQALKRSGIKSTLIRTTKPPRGFTAAPFVIEKSINLNEIRTKTLIFEGNTLEAARGFPANINVAVALSLAGAGPEHTKVQIWADPEARGNSHEITVEGHTSRLHMRIDNIPDPDNPKTSQLAAQSILSILRYENAPLILG